MTDYFALRRLYSREEISGVVGGGVQDFLPHAGGRVVCACLTPDKNPDAPYVILVGDKPDVSKYGEVLAAQTGAIPVFLKRATNAWQYVGRFSVESASTNPEELARWGAVSGRRGELTRVIYLVREA